MYILCKNIGFLSIMRFSQLFNHKYTKIYLQYISNNYENHSKNNIVRNYVHFKEKRSKQGAFSQQMNMLGQFQGPSWKESFVLLRFFYDFYNYVLSKNIVFSEKSLDITKC